MLDQINKLAQENPNQFPLTVSFNNAIHESNFSNGLEWIKYTDDEILNILKDITNNDDLDQDETTDLYCLAINIYAMENDGEYTEEVEDCILGIMLVTLIESLHRQNMIDISQIDFEISDWRNQSEDIKFNLTPLGKKVASSINIFNDINSLLKE